MRLRGLPAWIPSPKELIAARDGGAGGWVHALTPLLFALTLLVAYVQGTHAELWCVGAVFPLAAIGACLAALPLARVAGRRVGAIDAQTLHLALASLTPWLVFAWYVDLRSDTDAGGGGALGNSVLVFSMIFLIVVMPMMLGALRRRPLVRVRRRLVGAVATLVTGFALAGVAAAATHRTVDALGAYRLNSQARTDEEIAATLWVHRLGLHITRRRVGDRCVVDLRFEGSEHHTTGLHRCDAPVRVYRRFVMERVEPFSRSQFSGVAFVAVGEEVFASIGSARFLLLAAPPWEWIACALLGVCLGLGTVRRVRRVTAAWRSLPVREGDAVDARVRCDDGTVVAMSAEGARGRVLVLGDPALATAFRDVAQDAVVVLPCTGAAWARCLDDLESSAQSFALAVMLLPAAPLLASPLLGMLSPLPAAP